MKLLFCMILTVCAVAVIAQRPSFEMSPMDWSTTTQISEIFPVATKKDLLVYVDASASPPVMAIRRRNNEGAYVPVANFTEDVSPFVSTNGKWVSVVSEGIVLFRVDENNEVSNVSFVPVTSGFLLSDDTFVGFDPNSELGDGNYTIRTFEYDAANMNWTEVAAAKLVIPFTTQTIFDISSYRATDTHLIVLDPSALPETLSVRIYARQANLSWNLIDTVPVNNTENEIGNVNYNGVDTLVYSALVQEGSSFGIVFIYTKINGQWVEQKFTTESVGYRPLGYLGLSVAFVDANNVIISAGFEGYTGGDSEGLVAGKVLFVTRNSDGEWEPALDLVGPYLFGLGVGVNDHDIVVPSFLLADSGATVTFYTAPICFTQPINVTCFSQQTNDCSDVSLSELYTINNPQCGAITAILNGFSLVNNQALSAQFTFTRGYGDDYTCNATVTCPAPPVAPVSNNNNNVNGADVLSFGLVSVVVSTAAMLL